MEFTRRGILELGVYVTSLIGLGALQSSAAAPDAAITEFTSGTETLEGGLTLTAPEIAENGNTVPIDVSAPGAVAIAVFADGNPEPRVFQVKFGPLNPTRFASTRIRLSKTQNVIAVAQMEDGTFHRASTNVKVTIGGCGG